MESGGSRMWRTSSTLEGRDEDPTKPMNYCLMTEKYETVFSSCLSN
jgi:hypothetical protein